MEELTAELLQDQEGPERARLKVSGPATVDQASRFRDALVEALEKADEVQVDLAAVTGIDVAGLQLLCSAHRSATGNGRRFRIEDGGNEAFRSAKLEAGFQRHTGCALDTSGTCIWIQGEN